MLGFQSLFDPIDQGAAGGQTAQAQLAALRHHLGAVFLHGGHARLTHLHQLDLGACDLLLGLHKVTAVGPDSTLGHGDHKVGVFTMEAGEVGQGGVVVGQVLAGVGVAHRDQVHIHTVCLHGGTQGGQPFGNCIHAHRKAFFLLFAGRTSGGGGLLLHIVAFRRKECNAGVSAVPDTNTQRPAKTAARFFFTRLPCCQQPPQCRLHPAGADRLPVVDRPLAGSCRPGASVPLPEPAPCRIAARRGRRFPLFVVQNAKTQPNCKKCYNFFLKKALFPLTGLL